MSKDFCGRLKYCYIYFSLFGRKLAMMLHPDKTEVAGAQESFKILGQARNFILKTFREY